MKEETIVESSGCIVIDKKNKAVILTYKMSEKQAEEIAKTMLSREDILNTRNLCFTKGKIENGMKKKKTAKKETEEEAGIPINEITIQKKLWSFNKKKPYGEKIIHMYAATTENDYNDENLHPSDLRHKAIKVNIDQVAELLGKQEEKDFWNSKSVQNKIQKLLQ